MSTTLFAYKTLGGNLAPVDDTGRLAIAKIGREEMVSITIKRIRNVQHHRKLFALLSLIHANQSRYPTVEDLLDAIKVHIGHANVLTLKNGREVYVPKSISFANMDQAQFEVFFDRVIECVVTEIIPGLHRADLERELLEFAA